MMEDIIVKCYKKKKSVKFPYCVEMAHKWDCGGEYPLLDFLGSDYYQEEIKPWLDEYIGKYNKEWKYIFTTRTIVDDAYFAIDVVQICFKDEELMTLFTLRLDIDIIKRNR